MITAIYLSCAAAVASATIPSIFPMFIDTRTSQSEVPTLRGMFPTLPKLNLPKLNFQMQRPETFEGLSELDILRGNLIGRSDAELRELYDHATIPLEIPVGLLEGAAIKVMRLQSAASWLNELYNGDELFERVCYDPDTGIEEIYNLGYIVVNGQRAAIGDFSIIASVEDPFESWKIGLVGDFTKKIPATCNPDDGMIINPMPYRAMTDVWRQLNGDPSILIGKSYLRWGIENRHWAWMVARVYDRDHPNAPQWVVTQDPNALANPGEAGINRNWDLANANVPVDLTWDNDYFGDV